MSFKEWIKKKRQPQFVYTFLCHRCDILYKRVKLDATCPICGGSDAKIYTVRDYDADKDAELLKY